MKFLNRRVSAVLAFWICLASPGLGQDSTGNVMDVVQQHMDSNRYWKAFLDSRRYPVPQGLTNSAEVQIQLTFASFLGKNRYYDELIEMWERNIDTHDSLRRIVLGSPFRDDLAIDKIIESAKEKQVVMVNENHFYPNHRLLAMDILPRLKELGYNYFALETLYEGQDTVLNETGAYPTLQTGYYLREQNFSNLLRLGKSLGFRFVSYENTDPEKDREIGQAENLYQKTLGVDSSAKVFVFAGASHIMEQPDARGKKWMAAVFKERYGIDPLTVGQIGLNIYRHSIPGNYALLESKQFENQGTSTAYDFLIVNNKRHADFWDSAEKYHNTTNHEVQVALFYFSELGEQSDAENRIPYFTTLVQPGEQTELPYIRAEGAYLVVYDGKGDALEKRPINQH